MHYVLLPKNFQFYFLKKLIFFQVYATKIKLNSIFKLLELNLDKLVRDSSACYGKAKSGQNGYFTL